MDKSRRYFLDLSVGVVISTGLSRLSFGTEEKLGTGEFLHGVASGDPLVDKVIIWTRVTPQKTPASVRIVYEVSLFDNFSQLIQTGLVVALKDNDYTVKVDLQELEAGTRYYYRFRAANNSSMVGRTSTLPKETNNTTLAVFSCANYTCGFFNAYRDACKFKDKIDVVVHLGDYIYEYGMTEKNGEPAYGTKNAKKIGRVLPKSNDKKLNSLGDFRRRYALYKRDTDLQDLHQLFPFICIWDDHEVIDNAYNTGAEQSKLTAPKYRELKHAAVKAYYEWLPIRPPFGAVSEKIYRSFHFGELFSLYMLDTRLLNRTQQLNYNDYFNAKGDFDEASYLQGINSSKREMLGNEQLKWLEEELQNSQSKWQFIAQQVKVSKSLVPLEIIALANRYKNTAEQIEKEKIKQKIVNVFYETSRIKARMILKDANLTSDEKNRLNHMLPYNLDAWDGYPDEREKLYIVLKEINKATVVLSGDAHYSWANSLINKTNNTLGLELGVTSVTSPGIEEDYDIDDPELLRQLEDSTQVFDKNSIYSNYSDRGYLIIEINNEEVKAHWRYINTILSREHSIKNERSQLLRVGYKNGRYYWSDK